MLRSLRSLSLALAAASLALAPAAANAAAKKPVYPKVTSVSPLKLAVGDLLTIKGTGFRAGAGQTTIVFQRTGKPAVFVKASGATKTRLSLRVPDKLAAFLAQKDGAAVPTRFKLRVLTSKFARSWTSAGLSPTIGAKAGAAGTTPGGGPAAGAAPQLTPYEQCQKDAAANAGADADSDGLSNATELAYKLDPCNADTDGDGVTDGYEFQSAKDLNTQALPYPGKKPYPNPLDASDAGSDFDGDGLFMADEYALWRFKGGAFNADGTLPYYSDGTQNTGGKQPVGVSGLDLDGDHNLTDDERDADGDGLSNIVERRTSGTLAWWAGVYKQEKPYLWRPFAEPDFLAYDSNGNGVPDGADDQDNDGYSNYDEMQLGRARTGLYVQAFNPCLPNPYSLTCGRYVPLDPGTAWPPFDGKLQHPWDALAGKGSLVPFTYPADASSMSTTPPTTPAGPGTAWNGQGGVQG